MGKSFKMSKTFKDAKKQIKKLEALQQEFQQANRLRINSCPHSNKHGESVLENIEVKQDGLKRGWCPKCQSWVLCDENALTPSSIPLSVEVIKTANAVLRRKNNTGEIKIPENLLDAMLNYESFILDDMSDVLFRESSECKKKKKIKKDKKAKKFKREHFR